ncbi:MAG: hypothetical protein ABI472_20330 [Ginsengibacter sp.]
MRHEPGREKGIINISESLSATCSVRDSIGCTVNNQNKKNGRFPKHSICRTNRGGKMPEQFEMLLKKISGINSGFTKIAVPTAEGFELIAATDVI